MRLEQRLLLLIILTVVSSHLEAQPAQFSQKHLDEFSSVVGVWKMDRGKRWLFEEWKLDKGQLTGRSYQTSEGITKPLEDVRVFLLNGQIFYAPVAFRQNDEKEVLFELKHVKNGEFLFENTKHDFPQKIMYHVIANDSLHAYIEGTINGEIKRRDFNYQRQK